jgi:hypothetical protein
LPVNARGCRFDDDGAMIGVAGSRKHAREAVDPTGAAPAIESAGRAIARVIVTHDARWHGFWLARYLPRGRG